MERASVKRNGRFLTAWPISCHRHLFLLATMAGIVWISGCVADDAIDQATTQFVQASTTLAQSYQALLANANSIEAEDYINNETFAAMNDMSLPEAQITGPGIADQALLTPEEITLRVDAIKTLSAYTTALATLASGKSADQIQADASAASSSVKSFATDLTPYVAHPPKGTKAPDFATPASAAVTAIGDVLKLIEAHRSAAEIRDNIKANDPKIVPLFVAMESESSHFFQRATTDLETYYIGVLGAYNRALEAKPIDKGSVLELSRDLLQAEKNLATLKSSDPAPAINKFQKAHTALVNLVTTPGTSEKKRFLAELIAEVKSFVAEVKAPSKNASAPAGQDS